MRGTIPGADFGMNRNTFRFAAADFAFLPTGANLAADVSTLASCFVAALMGLLFEADKSPVRGGVSRRQTKELPHRGPTSLADYPHRSCEWPSRDAAAAKL